MATGKKLDQYDSLEDHELFDLLQVSDQMDDQSFRQLSKECLKRLFVSDNYFESFL